MSTEKATAIAIENLDRNSRTMSERQTRMDEGLRNQALSINQLHEKLSAFEHRIHELEVGSMGPGQLVPGIVEQLRDLSAKVEPLLEDFDLDSVLGQQVELLKAVADALLDPRFRDFLKNKRPLSSAHTAQLYGVMELLSPYYEPEDHPLSD